MKTIIPFSYTSFYLFKLLKVFAFCILFIAKMPGVAVAQCPGGYTSATANWDNLDYLHRTGSTYGGTNPVTGLPFVTAAMAQTQYFAIGTNKLTINTPINIGGTNANAGDATTHTGDVTGYTGADVHLIPSSNGQTIIMTFQTEVQNAGFSIYDIDRSAVYTITAYNAANVAQTVTVTTYTGTILTIGGTPTARTITATNTALGNTVNTGTATITIAGPLDSIRVVATTIGSNAEIFLSDITACVADPGFPTNYYSTYTQPFTGQPSYFLANPQNLHVYMVNASTGVAQHLFSDPGGTPAGSNKMNSLAYDPVNHWLYYVMDNATNYPGNLILKKYDFSTNTISTVISNLNTFGIPSFIQGVEYAGASYYNGSLYLGIEGSDGTSYGTYAESVVWRIDFDGSGNATGFCQVFGTPGDNGGGAPRHDWGDFITKDGTIITHATGPTTTSNHYIHYDLQTGASTSYNGNAVVAGQLGQTWNGNVYRINNAVALYNNDGTIGSTTSVTVTSCSPAWSGNAGDASDPFKPQSDFGDAPATYDPVALSPAVHDSACNNTTLRIGSLWDKEWSKYTSADASGDVTDEDGIGTVNIMVSDGIAYNHVQDVTVLNNTGANATLGAWLDYDADGLFEASEGVIVTVSSSASPQTITLLWSGITVAIGTPNSFLRVRLVSGTGTMGVSNATGWYSDGEVEDYRVISSATPLAMRLLDFNAYVTTDKNVQLNWSAAAGNDGHGFEIQRSTDQNNWEAIGWVDVNTSVTTSRYSFTDQQPKAGKSYYRLKLVEQTGSSRFSSAKWVYLDEIKNNIIISPNPVSAHATVMFTGTTNNTTATLRIRSLSGQIINSRPVLINAGQNSISLDASALSPGIYMVELSAQEKTYIRRMAVTR